MEKLKKRATDLELRVIPSKVANQFIKKHHYSGKVVSNSNLHFGVFWDNKLEGVMSFGPPLDKSKLLPLVEGTGWNEMLELNRMAFTDKLPRNSESCAISRAIKLIKKNAPQVKWIVSFADGCSCGDGTIYRASNFILTGVRPNKNIAVLPNGEKIHKITLVTSANKKRPELNGRSFFDISDGSYSFKKYVKEAKAEILEGFQLRYIYFIDKRYREKLTVPEIPFSRIDELGAGMYKGEKIEVRARK